MLRAVSLSEAVLWSLGVWETSWPVEGSAMASPIQKFKEFIGSDDGDLRSLYRCHACDNQFMSAKVPKRAQCPECLDNDVEQVESQ